MIIKISKIKFNSKILIIKIFRILKKIIINKNKFKKNIIIQNKMKSAM